MFDASTLNGSFTFSASDRDFNAADPRTYPDRLQVRVPGVSDYFVKGKEIGVFAQDKWKMNSRLTASLGLRYDLEIVPIDQTGNYLFSDPTEYPVDKNNFSPRVGADLDARRARNRRWCAADGACTSRRRRTRTSRRSCRAGAVSNSFSVNLCGPPTAPICPSATSVDPGPSAGRLPTNPFLVNGPVVEQGALELDVPAGHDAGRTRAR